MLLVTFCLSSSTLFAQRLLITPAAVTIEEGESGDFTVTLSSEPTSDVTVTIVRSDGMNVNLDKTVLIFTPSNWNLGQTVTMMAEEDADFADNTGTLIFIASGGGYDGGGVTVSPETVLIESVDKAVQLNAMIQDQDGVPVTGVSLEWSSADTSVAVVDSTGKVTGVSNGTTEITAALATASAAATILVEDSSLILSDRKILEIFYEATGGDEWGNNMGWLTDAPLDQWHGVGTDEDGRVTTLSLRENGLKGIIPVELGGLTNLEILSLDKNNQLTGPLPPKIGNLVRLRELDLGNTGLEGEIPSTLGKLVKLLRMNFEYVPFTGSIPPELGALTELDFLNLYRNRLSGRVPTELAGLRSLRTLYLNENNLTGSIPTTFVQLENLEIFYWQRNGGLCAPGTTDFETWRSANDRRFTGPRCNESDLTVLKTFYESTDGANWTNSTGWLGDTAVEEWYGVNADSLGHITSLDLQNNGLRGQLSSVLGNLDQLSVLRVDGNPLSGRIPLLLTNLALQEFRYVNTDLCVPATITFQQWINSISVHEGTGIQCPALSDEREILSMLYKATGGVDWNQQDGWLTNAPLDQWHGVETDEDGRVITLILRENGLKGIIPAELGGLSHLEILNLHGNNQLTGPLPPKIGNLERLRELDLGNTDLEGEIPSTMGKLVKLRRMNFEYVPFTGSIPSELGALTELEILNLYQNRLSGRVPAELAGLRSLRTLYLDENYLTGSIPSKFVQLEELTTFNWQDNDGLCAPGTTDFETWRSAKDRRFTGPRCNESDVTVLKTFYESTDGANWTHSTDWLGDMAVEEWYGVNADSLGHVTSLDLPNNGLRGQLSSVLVNLDQLSVLRVDDNPLSGRIPSLLTGLALEEFRYANTDLCVPAAVTFQQWLNSISIHEGTGIQCPALSEREILSVLYEATGGVDWKQQGGWLTNAPLGDWHGVTVDGDGRVVELALFGNNLRGRIPLELEGMANLRLLDLSFNWLEGIITPGLGRIRTLTELYLESNTLSGSIPAELGQLFQLRVLFLHDNRLEGAIPPELGNLSNLRHLRISQNRLSGRIPPEFGNLSAAQVIWMHGNQFEGEIPPELENLYSVRVLYAGDNNLFGAIPPELGNLQFIIELAFDGNNLTGPIPPELGNLESLNGELNLRENSLSGEIPPELGNLKNLKRLRLGDNKLSGSVPPEIGRMHALEWLDLSHNPGLTGPLPSAFADLANLRRLEFGGTGLCVAPDSPLADPAVARRFRLPFCGPSPVERSTAYLVQSIQSAQYPIPLVAGEDALLRVFPISTQSTNASIPPVRATLFVDGAEVHTADIPGQSTPIPTELAYAQESLDRSANIQIPGSVVQPGLEMIIEIDPDGTLDPGLEMVRRIPESGQTPVDVEVMPRLELTMVPFVWQARPDYTADQLVEEMMQNPEGHRLLSETRILLPVDDISITAHPSVLTSSNNSDALLDEVGVIRILENGTGYWMGALSGEATGAWGVAWINGWTSYVRLGVVDQSEEALTIAHELGHSMSLYHAPCGTSSVLDPGYPYPNAEIGAWGIDSRSGSDVLVPSSWSDMMSYCVPAWISEYNFYIAMNHRLDQEASGKSVAASTPALLVWGGTDEGGMPYLNPVFAVDAPPSMPDGGGDHQITGRTVDGDVLFSVAFDMKPVADTEGRAGFAFAIPSSREWTDVLAEVELSGPGGAAIIDEDSNLPALILREQTSGQVRALLRGESAALIGLDATAAASLVQETDVEVLFSRGLPQSARR